MIECSICYEDFPPAEKISCTVSEPCSSTFITHSFCPSCIRGHAMSAVNGDSPIAKGGRGLLCLETGCDNRIDWADFHAILPPELEEHLGERLQHECLLQAGCKCGFAAAIDDESVAIFSCPSCSTRTCRRCRNDAHVGHPCEANADFARKKREEELTAATIRQCPNCHLAFDKVEGCNRMICRCGLTQCYLCRKVKIDYRHFCPHVRDPDKPWDKCPCKKCLLWEGNMSKEDMERALKDAMTRRNARLAQVVRPFGPAQFTRARADGVAQQGKQHRRPAITRPAVVAVEQPAIVPHVPIEPAIVEQQQVEAVQLIGLFPAFRNWLRKKPVRNRR